MLKGKTIVLGITGGIAAYKAADLASKLTQAGAKVEVVMTAAAQKFITPLTLRNITRRPVVTDMFELASEYSVEHVALAEAADVVVIAPATANTIARLAAGIADDMLSTVVLATEAPVIIAPAMNDNMYRNSVTQQNVQLLKARGFTFIEPEQGRLASGKIGKGRLPETATIIEVIEKVLGKKSDLEGKRIVVTAGGTQEPIDPVRLITNRSSGKMGYALAEAARDRGAQVTLISAPAALSPPDGVEIVKVRTVADLREAVLKAVKKADVLIMAAAVSDFRVAKQSGQKIKKQGGKLSLELVENEDFLLELLDNFIKVGFAAESENMVANAKKKLKEKRLDMIVANDITQSDAGFDVDTNRVTIIDKKGKVEDVPLMSKRDVAEKILDRIKGMIVCQMDSNSLQKSMVITLMRSYINHYYIHIPIKYKDWFPNHETKIYLITDKLGVLETSFYPKEDGGLGFNGFDMPKWFKAYPKPKEGDKVRITVIEQTKKYRLEIVK